MFCALACGPPTGRLPCRTSASLPIGKRRRAETVAQTARTGQIAGTIISNETIVNTMSGRGPDGGTDFTLDDFLPYLVNVLAARLSVELGAEYGRRFSISIPEWRVLAHLSQHERVSVREIYRRVEMDGD